jgi:hypothetical protein
MDAGSARKLFFLSAWIHLLLSQQFVASLDDAFVLKNGKSPAEKKKTKVKEFQFDLAQYGHLRCLGYPLNSLLDRCQERCVDHDLVSHPGSDLTETSRTMRGYLIEILGSSYVPNFGYVENEETAKSVDESATELKTIPTANKDSKEAGAVGHVISREITREENTTMSLEEMEALLSGDQEMAKETPTAAAETVNDEANFTAFPSNDALEMSQPRKSWVKCETWDPCAIGTLPGYPH